MAQNTVLTQALPGRGREQGQQTGPLGPLSLHHGHSWVFAGKWEVGQRNPTLPECGVHLCEGPVGSHSTGVGHRVCTGRGLTSRPHRAPVSCCTKQTSKAGPTSPGGSASSRRPGSMGGASVFSPDQVIMVPRQCSNRQPPEDAHVSPVTKTLPGGSLNLHLTNELSGHWGTQAAWTEKRTQVLIPSSAPSLARYVTSKSFSPSEPQPARYKL